MKNLLKDLILVILWVLLLGVAKDLLRYLKDLFQQHKFQHL